MNPTISLHHTGYRKRLEDMGQPVPDERYEDTIIQALPAEYERVRTAKMGFPPRIHSTHNEFPVHGLPLQSKLLSLGRESWGCPVFDRGGRQSHQLPLLRQFREPPQNKRRVDCGPTQKTKTARHSFDTVQALERKERRRE